MGRLGLFKHFMHHARTGARANKNLLFGVAGGKKDILQRKALLFQLLKQGGLV